MMWALPACSFGRDLSQFTLTVGQSDVEFLGTSNNDFSGFGGEALGDLTGVDAVVHQEEFDVLFVSDEELLEARLELVSGLLVLLGTDLGLSNLASEASSDT